MSTRKLIQEPAQERVLRVLASFDDDGFRASFELGESKSTLKQLVRKGYATCRLLSRKRKPDGKAEPVPCYRITSRGRTALVECEEERSNPPEKHAFSRGNAPDVGQFGHPWRGGAK